jgi:hypothetical protein
MTVKARGQADKINWKYPDYANRAASQQPSAYLRGSVVT